MFQEKGELMLGGKAELVDGRREQERKCELWQLLSNAHVLLFFASIKTFNNTQVNIIINLSQGH